MLKIQGFIFSGRQKVHKNQTSFSTPERQLNFVMNGVNIKKPNSIKATPMNKFCLYLLKKKINQKLSSILRKNRLSQYLRGMMYHLLYLPQKKIHTQKNGLQENLTYSVISELESLQYYINNKNYSLQKLFNNLQVVWIKQM